MARSKKIPKRPTHPLQDVLATFAGKTPDQIAEAVGKHGIKGRMGTTYGCPMALLLDSVSTGRYVIGRRYIARVCGKKIERARTPDNIAVFVRKFDLGQYPNLIAPPPRCLAPRAARKRPSGTRGYKNGPIKNHLAKLVERFHAVA